MFVLWEDPGVLSWPQNVTRVHNANSAMQIFEIHNADNAANSLNVRTYVEQSFIIWCDIFCNMRVLVELASANGSISVPF